VSGSLEVVRSTSPEGLIHISTLSHSDVFGEMGLCTGEPRSANVICKEECVLLEIQRKHLIPLMEESPEILETIGTLMAQRRQRLQAMNQERDETRRQALIRRMQKLFASSGEM
jgi:CRP-like cAMP-binding protein